MKAKVLARFIKFGSGVSKDGNPWFYIKFHDEEAMEYPTYFASPLLQANVEGLTPGTPVTVEFSISKPGKYARIELTDVYETK